MITVFKKLVLPEPTPPQRRAFESMSFVLKERCSNPSRSSDFPIGIFTSENAVCLNQIDFSGTAYDLNFTFDRVDARFSSAVIKFLRSIFLSSFEMFSMLRFLIDSSFMVKSITLKRRFSTIERVVANFSGLMDLLIRMIT